MSDRFDTIRVQRTEDLKRSWDETQSRIQERIIPIEHISTTHSSVMQNTTGHSTHQAGTHSIPTSPVRTFVQDGSSTAATSSGGATIGASIGENGSVFTLTNIYTFGGDNNAQGTVSDHAGLGHDSQDVSQHYREQHSSSSYTRRVHTTSTEQVDFDDDANYLTTRLTHNSTGSYGPRRTPTTTSYYSQLSTVFTDTQRKIRLWIEHLEKSLLIERFRPTDISSIHKKIRIYKDLLEQTTEQENHLLSLNDLTRDYISKLTHEQNHHLKDELNNYANRLADIRLFLDNSLARCQHLEKQLTEFQYGMDQIHQWIRTTNSRFTSTEIIHGGSKALESQLGKNQILQEEIQQMQTLMNSLNHDLIHLINEGDDILGRNLRDEMHRLNQSWSQVISTSKTSSQNIQDALKRTKILEEEIREIEDWIQDRNRQILLEDDSIFYPDQLRDRFDFYQKLQSEINLKEISVRNLVDQVRQDSTHSSIIVDDFITKWSNLQKKIDGRTAFFAEVYQLYEELRDLLQAENLWLDQLQNRVYSSISSGADAEEISEELDILESFVKSHLRQNYDRILEIGDRLQSMKISMPTVVTQIHQFQTRWQQVHEDVTKKIQTLNSQIHDSQQLGHEITAMFEWLRHTENTLNARLRDDVYASDVPSETERFFAEFRQYENFLRTLEAKIQNFRALGKNDAARRLEQQYILLKNQFIQVETKFRQFQKPSDFEPKFNDMRRILHEVEQNLYTLEIRSDDPEIIHEQLEHCLKLYKTLSDIKPEVEYVIRTGRTIAEKGQTTDTYELNRQIDQLKLTYNNLGDKISSSKKQLDNVERHSRKFKKEYSHIHEWLVKADAELRKIENKQVSKNTKEEVDWIRTTRSDIRKLEANFETLRNLERSIQRETDRPLTSIHEKITELKRQIDQLDRRLRDRHEIVEGQVKKLDDDYRRFTRIYDEIIIRLEKLESLLSDAERALDVTRVTQVQEEIRSVRTQLDELLNLGQELVSKSERYSRLVGPDVETITRKFEELQRRIRVIQETQEKHIKEQQIRSNIIENNQNDDVHREYYTEKRYHRTQRETRQRSPSESSEFSTTHGVIDEEFKKKYLRCLAYMKLIERLYENQVDSDEEYDVSNQRSSRRERGLRSQPEYEEIERIIRETEERACIIERTDIEQAQRIREKIRRLKDGLESLKLRSDQWQTNDEIVRYNERFSQRISTQERTVPAPRERELDSDFIYDIDDTRSVISEPAPFHNTKYRKTVHSLERYRTDDHSRHVPTHEEYQLQPLLRVRSLKAIDHRALSAPSSPILQPRFRSYERSNVQYTKQSNNQQAHHDNYQSSISKSASMPNGGFPVHQNLLPQPPPAPVVPCLFPNQPMTYRERVIDRHVAEKSTSRGESHRQQQHQEAHSQSQQQTKQHHQAQQRSASASAQQQFAHRSIPVQYEVNATGNDASQGFRQTQSFGQESTPNYFFHEQYPAGVTAHNYRQHYFDQQPHPTNYVGGHPTRTYN